MPRFVIDLGDIKMSDKATEALNEDLQKTALAHVAGMRIKTPVAIKFPRPFPWGIIVRPDFDGVLTAEKQLTEVFERLR